MAVSKIKFFILGGGKKKKKMQRQLSDKHQKIHLQIILKITFISSTVYCQEKKTLTISLWIQNWVAPVNLHLITIRNMSIKAFKFISGLIRKLLVFSFLKHIHSLMKDRRTFGFSFSLKIQKKKNQTLTSDGKTTANTHYLKKFDRIFKLSSFLTLFPIPNLTFERIRKYDQINKWNSTILYVKDRMIFPFFPFSAGRQINDKMKT